MDPEKVGAWQTRATRAWAEAKSLRFKADKARGPEQEQAAAQLLTAAAILDLNASLCTMWAEGEGQVRDIAFWLEQIQQGLRGA